MKSLSKNPAKATLTRKVFLRKIGAVIRELRLKKHLSPKQAALRCGCSLEQWKRYEEKGVPATHIFLKIIFSLADPLSKAVALLEKTFPHQMMTTLLISNFPGPIKRNMDGREIQSLLQKEERPLVKEKLQALLWLANGMKVKEVGKRLGLNRGLIQAWLGRYYKSGIGWVLGSTRRTHQIFPY